MPAVNTPLRTSPKSSTTTACSPRSARSATPFDNALAESFVDSVKTELLADRVWPTRSQLELAVLEYLSWFNNTRRHEALGDKPPSQFEQTKLAQPTQPQLAGFAGSTH